jgi:hypothetical protein
VVFSVLHPHRRELTGACLNASYDVPSCAEDTETDAEPDTRHGPHERAALGEEVAGVEALALACVVLVDSLLRGPRPRPRPGPGRDDLRLGAHL